MNLKLVSDFKDYYDAWFDRDGHEFHRVTTGGPSRREMFRLFDGMRIPTPRYGLVRDMAADVKWMVVYLREELHRGDGKVLMPADVAREIHPDVFCSEYIGGTNNEPTKSYKDKWFGWSWRQLVVGFRSFWLHYSNCDDWRSNVGDDINIVLESSGERPKKKDFKYPLYAVDYVLDCPQRGTTRFLAVDLNIAPGFGGTEVQDTFPAFQVVQELKEWTARNFKLTAV